jgi:hypothetical protein
VKARLQPDPKTLHPNKCNYSKAKLLFSWLKIRHDTTGNIILLQNQAKILFDLNLKMNIFLKTVMCPASVKILKHLDTDQRNIRFRWQKPSWGRINNTVKPTKRRS